MKKNNYALAGWLAITSFVVFCPLIVMSFIYDILTAKSQTFIPGLYAAVALLTIVQMACSVYAFYQFKNLLNERYQFHDVDMLVIIIIIGSILLVPVILIFRAIPVMNLRIIGALAVGAIGMPLAIIGIVFSVKLLRLNQSLHGLLKPLAFTNLAACCFFLTFILAIFGLMLAAAFDLLLGIAFLRGEEKEPETEFV
jgi:hypothetical protein